MGTPPYGSADDAHLPVNGGLFLCGHFTGSKHDPLVSGLAVPSFWRLTLHLAGI